MKTRRINTIFSILSLFILTSCAPVIRNLQVCQFEAPGFVLEGNCITKHEDDINVSLNLWNLQGSNTLFITNKTKSDLLVDLSKSFIIIDGKAYDLKSSESGLIPDNAYKHFQISQSITDVIWLSQSEMSVKRGYKEINYTRSNTPLTYRVKLVYTTANGQSHTKDYEIWVSSIVNYAKTLISDDIILEYNPELYYDVDPSPSKLYNYYFHKANSKGDNDKNQKAPITVRKERK